LYVKTNVTKALIKYYQSQFEQLILDQIPHVRVNIHSKPRPVHRYL